MFCTISQSFAPVVHCDHFPNPDRRRDGILRDLLVLDVSNVICMVLYLAVNLKCAIMVAVFANVSDKNLFEPKEMVTLAVLKDTFSQFSFFLITYRQTFFQFYSK